MKSTASCEADALPGGFYRDLREAHDRTTARWPAAPWMLTRAFAKRVRCQEGFNEAQACM